MQTPVPLIFLGAHFSIGKGLADALAIANRYACNTLQLFTKNARSWKERLLTDDEVAQFLSVREKYGIKHIVSHTSYLINLATPDPEKGNRAAEALYQELFRSSRLQIDAVVLHPGAHMGDGIDKGIRRIADHINQIHDRIGTSRACPRLLLETTAGQGTSIGHTFEQLAEIVALITSKDHIGICLDTAHIFAAGYDLRTADIFERIFSQFDRTLGRDSLALIHLNDSMPSLGSHKDRHTHIGLGEIGSAAFARLMRDESLRLVPKIIETPQNEPGRDWDLINLRRLREMAGNL